VGVRAGGAVRLVIRSKLLAHVFVADLHLATQDYTMGMRVTDEAGARSHLRYQRLFTSLAAGNPSLFVNSRPTR
jgi:hypothetical protein